MEPFPPLPYTVRQVVPDPVDALRLLNSSSNVIAIWLMSRPYWKSDAVNDAAFVLRRVRNSELDSFRIVSAPD